MKVLLKDEDGLFLTVVTQVFFDCQCLKIFDFFDDLILISNMDRDLAEYYIMKLYNNDCVDLSEFKYEYIQDDDYEYEEN